ncbi:hypothetical protein A3B18_03895 [Candidatus Giovannonibacteria bacterium RIFCSPLOWO2_01_FULL_46_13]|uniref:Ig-like domain-containing protein n=1 Tax=Candidatus Giovannonibacteria bacterium RIFCSPLOWO2_01_FULL_46_13 TaxID=1798352 RepID=A0A1F5X4X5_9BACT|nr:MAG: hypothetical protein A3B18_03895 [Candidatus Giovannonibacteria bacterium RIFCSPLOWO2_01_FULL_46_13]
MVRSFLGILVTVFMMAGCAVTIQSNVHPLNLGDGGNWQIAAAKTNTQDGEQQGFLALFNCPVKKTTGETCKVWRKSPSQKAVASSATSPACSGKQPTVPLVRQFVGPIGQVLESPTILLEALPSEEAASLPRMQPRVHWPRSRNSNKVSCQLTRAATTALERTTTALTSGNPEEKAKRDSQGEIARSSPGYFYVKILLWKF